MIFIGDIAQPWNYNKVNFEIPNLFKSKMVIANLEGAIADVKNKSENLLRKKVLFNDAGVIGYLKALNVRLVNLANNHIFDIGQDINFTKKILEENGVKSVGAGKNSEEAKAPVEFIVNGEEFLFFSFGWGPIGCVIADKNTAGVNPLNPQSILKQIKTVKKDSPDKHIIVMFHWNYELEIFPQPMFRELSKDLIDEGVELIVGHHSHCVQGIELYKGIPIVYGLGNWLLPSGFFWRGILKFPELVNTELAFEWNYKEKKFLCHWFKFNSDTNEIRYLFSENLDKSNIIKELTPFSEMGKKKYEKWFAENRRKNKFLPIYKSYKDIYLNNFKDFEIKVRKEFIDLLVKLNLKGHPN